MICQMLEVVLMIVLKKCFVIVILKLFIQPTTLLKSLSEKTKTVFSLKDLLRYMVHL